MRTLRRKPIYKIYFRYKKLNLWKARSCLNLNKKKWKKLKNQKFNQPLYLCHYKKLNIERLYYYKFLNKQILKHYLGNYTEKSFNKLIKKKFTLLESRLDLNLYKVKFFSSLYEVRFYITKGYIFVNEHQIKNINFCLSTNDKITIYPTIHTRIKNNLLKALKKTTTSLLNLQKLEVDYTIYSFIYLKKSEYNIFAYKKFIKKINFKQFTYHENLLSSNNTYYKLLNYIYKYYLFCKFQNKKLKISYFTSKQIVLLVKYIRYYYKTYFFRNLLLKQVHTLKYNFLLKLKLIKLKKLPFCLSIDLKQDLEKKQLLFEFNKYLFKTIFWFYISLLKTTNLSQFKNNFFLNNSYSVNLFMNNKYYLNLIYKCKFYKYFMRYTANINYIDVLDNKKFKLIKSLTVPNQSKNKICYLTYKNYLKIIKYISSIQYKYKIYKKCNSFQQNAIKRIKLIKYLRKTLTYKYFNRIKLGTYQKIITNKVLLKTLQRTQNFKLISKNNKQASYGLYKNFINEFNFQKDYYIKQSSLLLQKLILLRKSNIQNSLVIDYITKLNLQISIFNLRKDNKYNIYYKNLYLLKILIQQIKYFSISYNLLNTKYNILYKIHIKHNYKNKNTSKSNSKYLTSRTMSPHFYHREKLKYFYLKYYKKHSLFAKTWKHYFLKLKTRSSYIQQTLIKYITFHKNNQYALKIVNKKDDNIYSKTYLFNSKLILNNKQFNDQQFLLQLFFNISTRKINNQYNNIVTKIIKNQKKKLAIISDIKFSKSNIIMSCLRSTKICSMNFQKKKNKSNYCYLINPKSIYKIKFYFVHFQKLTSKQVKSNNILTKQILNIKQLNQLYFYYNSNIRKYRILKYLFNNFIWKEYSIFIKSILTIKKIKTIDQYYIQQLFFNLLFSKFYNLTKFDSIFITSYKYSQSVQILIKYFVLIKRYYK